MAAPRLTSTFTEDDFPQDETLVGPKELTDAKPMRGLAYLLLWLPAACDLTGTTVSFILCDRSSLLPAGVYLRSNHRTLLARFSKWIQPCLS